MTAKEGSGKSLQAVRGPTQNETLQGLVHRRVPMSENRHLAKNILEDLNED